MTETENGEECQATVYSEEAVRAALERKDPDMLLAVSTALCPEMCKGKAVLLERDSHSDLIRVFVCSTEQIYAFHVIDLVELALEFYLETGIVCDILRQLKKQSHRSAEQ